jgi:hypothetical protein
MNFKNSALVRSIMDYEGIIWDPYLITDVDSLEVKHQVARFITGDYKTRGPVFMKKEFLNGSVFTLWYTRTLEILMTLFSFWSSFGYKIRGRNWRYHALNHFEHTYYTLGCSS